MLAAIVSDMRGLNVAVALGLLVATPAQAETIRSRSGATAHVSAAHAGKFQAFIDDLESTGYRISFMGGTRRGRCAPPRHKHPCGAAIDINQTARDVVTRRFPPGTNEMARRHGLLHGAEWRRSPDAGHFEVR